jgi:hypothetical protein
MRRLPIKGIIGRMPPDQSKKVLRLFCGKTFWL